MRLVTLEENCPLLVADAEVAAAKKYLDLCNEYAGHELAVPRAIVRGMLEAAAAVRAGLPTSGQK